MTNRQVSGFFLMVSFFFVSTILFADTWKSPTIRYFCSVNKVFCVKVFPKVIPKKYYNWLTSSPKKKSKFKPADTTVIPCHAQLIKIDGKDSTIIWDMKLINSISPVNGYITNDGKYFVTIDNWYNMGYGIDVMVIYNNKGEMLKRYNLESISPIPINNYMFSISSIHWFCGIKMIDNKQISICYLNDYINKNNKPLFRTYNLEELAFKN